MLRVHPFSTYAKRSQKLNSLAGLSEKNLDTDFFPVEINCESL